MEKIYWTLKEISEDIDIPYHIVRYWERHITLLKGIAKRNGKRTYTQQHLELYKQMKQLIYEEKLTLPGAKKQLLYINKLVRDKSSFLSNQQNDIILDDMLPSDKIKTKNVVTLSKAEFSELLQLIRLMIDVIKD